MMNIEHTGKYVQLTHTHAHTRGHINTESYTRTHARTHMHTHTRAYSTRCRNTDTDIDTYTANLIFIAFLTMVNLYDTNKIRYKKIVDTKVMR